jgi:hypothetical protein
LRPADWWIALAWWTGLLVGVRLLFAGYNRVSPEARLFYYPVLQLARVVGFAVLLVPSSAAGVLLLIAQWLRQSTNYLVYRLGGREPDFRRQRYRLIVVGCLALGYLAITRRPEDFANLPTAVIAGWLVYRALREHFGAGLAGVRSFGQAVRRGLGAAKKPAPAPAPAPVAAPATPAR